MKPRLEKLHQIAQLRKELDLAALAQIQAMRRANDLAHIELADARIQARIEGTKSTLLARTSAAFERWTDQRDKALIERRVALDQAHDDHLKRASESFGRATVIGSILRK